MKKLFLSFFSLLMHVNAFADWVPILNSVSYVGSVSYNGMSASVTEAGFNGKMASFVPKAYSLPYIFQTNIDDLLRKSLPGFGGTLISSAASGPFSISLLGLSGGLSGFNSLSFYGPSYNANFSATGNKFGIGYQCTGTLSLKEISATVVYNPYDGTINSDQNLTKINLNPVVSIDCTSSLSGIPVLGNLIQEIFVKPKEVVATEAFKSKINSISQTIVSSFIPVAPNYLGVYSALPSLPYNLQSLGGLDVIAYIKNNFAYLFTGRQIKITVGVHNLPSAIKYGVPKQADYLSVPLTIDFSDSSIRLSFSISEVANYEWEASCTKATRTC